MDDTSAASSALNYIVHIVKTLWSVPWAKYGALTASTLTWPFRMLWVPVSYALSILDTALAPARYVLSYMSSWVFLVVRIVMSLEVRESSHPFHPLQSFPCLLSLHAETNQNATLCKIHRIATLHIRMFSNRNEEQETLALRKRAL